MYGKKKNIALIVLLIIVILGIYTLSNKRNDEINACYKPMVKVNDIIYYWVKDLDDTDLTGFTMIGEVEKSYNSGLKSIDEKSDDFSSNVFPKGSKIYIYDDTSIIVETDEGISLLESNK